MPQESSHQAPLTLWPSLGEPKLHGVMGHPRRGDFYDAQRDEVGKDWTYLGVPLSLQCESLVERDPCGVCMWASS